MPSQKIFFISSKASGLYCESCRVRISIPLSKSLVFSNTVLKSPFFSAHNLIVNTRKAGTYIDGISDFYILSDNIFIENRLLISS